MTGCIKYSQTIQDLSSVTIIDGVVVKNRNRDDRSMEKNEIERMKEARSNIVVQEGFVVDIYCSKEEADNYIDALSGLSHGGNIRIHT